MPSAGPPLLSLPVGKTIKITTVETEINEN
jgi:hypothetical protein